MSAPSAAARIASPRTTALWVAGGYLVLGLLYIGFSDSIAEGLTRDKAELAWVSSIKGYAYVTVTALLLFVVLNRLLARIAAHALEIERKEAALAEAQSRSMCAVVAASIGHDVKNALAIAQLSLEQLEGSPEMAREQGEVLQRIEQAHDDLRDMAERLQRQGVGEEDFGGVQRQSVSGLVRETIGTVERARLLGSARVEAQLASSLVGMVDAGLLRRMLINLLLNASQATNERGSILVVLRKDGDRAILEVHDDGPGFGAPWAEQGPRPFMTTKSGGHGLGLMVLESFAQRQSAEYALGRSESLAGALVRVVWPLRAEVQQPVHL